MRLLIIAVLALVLAGCEEGDCCAPAPPDTVGLAEIAREDSARADTTWRLRFDGIGPIRVGMTFDEARAALQGDLQMSDAVAGMEDGPDRCDHPRTSRLPAGVRLMVEGQRVVRVEVNSGRTLSEGGVRIGDPESRIARRHPSGILISPHKYANGSYYTVGHPDFSDTTHLMVFETDGRVVTRFRAGQKPQVEYVEGCA